MATAALMSLPRQARAYDSNLLKIGYVYQQNSQLGAGATAFAKELDNQSQGRWSLGHFPNGVAGGEVEMLNHVATGQLDLAFITGAVIAGVEKRHGIFDVPFLFRDTRHARELLDGPIGRRYLEMFVGKPIVALAWGETGMRHITNSRRPIFGPADLKGLRLRLPQSDVMVEGFQTLGATAEQVPFPAVFGALESKAFDGQENPVATIEAAEFAQVQDNLSLTSHVYCTAIFFMSREVWKELTPADRTAFVLAAEAGGRASRQFGGRAELEGVERLRQQGMKIVPKVDRNAFAAALAPAEPYFRQLFGAAELDNFRTWRTP